MGDYDRECFNCGAYLSIDDEYREERNDYGLPVQVCLQCQGLSSSKEEKK